MFKKLLLFLSYISLSSQFFTTPKYFLPFQNKTTTQYYPSLTLNKEYEIDPKRNDAVTFFKMWATIFDFTFPVISFSYYKDN